MTARHTKAGFPVVPDIPAKTLASACFESSQPKKKKKSLFARQFENEDMSFFRVDSQPPSVVGRERDYVKPILIGEAAVTQSHDPGREATSEAGKNEYGSSAAEAWDR